MKPEKKTTDEKILRRRIISRFPGETRRQEDTKVDKMMSEDDSNISDDTKSYFEYLLNLREGRDDDRLPFFHTFPIMDNSFNINTFARNKIDEVIKAYEGNKISRSSEKYHIVTIIPFRGRWKHLQKTIESLLVSSKNISDTDIGIYIIENSKQPIFSGNSILNKKDVHYRWLNSNGYLFNKCICHNIGAAVSNSDFLHFHDCDIPVPVNFYEELINKLEQNGAVQAFNGRKVNYIHEIPTKLYFDGADIDTIIKDPENYREGKPGAPGGSIAVSRDLFDKVGGFDSHFFWAYSIEDKFFWDKIEKYVMISTLDNPKIDLYHIWHPPGWGKNPNERLEQRIYQMFCHNHRQSEIYMDTARDLYKLTVENIII